MFSLPWLRRNWHEVLIFLLWQFIKSNNHCNFQAQIIRETSKKSEIPGISTLPGDRSRSEPSTVGSNFPTSIWWHWWSIPSPFLTCYPPMSDLLLQLLLDETDNRARVKRTLSWQVRYSSSFQMYLCVYTHCHNLVSTHSLSLNDKHTNSTGSI